MTIPVLFPSGAHGHFLTVLLNHAVGVTVRDQESDVVFDHPVWNDVPAFEIEHSAARVASQPCVQIQIAPGDMLKWTVMTMSRASGLHIDLDTVHRDPWRAFRNHPHMAPLLRSLEKICACDHGEVSLGHMRDWARLCLFADDCRTLRMILRDSWSPSAAITVDFGDIYRDPMAVVMRILDRFDQGLSNTHDIQRHISKFEQRNRYRYIDLDLAAITDAIDQRGYLEFDSGNFVKQAWIDNYLATRYNVVPLLIDHYWTDTHELLEAYALR